MDELQERFSISRYQVRSDIAVLKSMQGSYGLRFHFDRSRRSVYFSVQDPSKADIYIPLFIKLYYRHNNNTRHHKQMVVSLIISWMLLASKKPIPSMAIAEEMGYSRSGLRDSLKWVKADSRIFHLACRSIPHHGLIMLGSEFNKRFSLISLNNFLDPRILTGLDQDLVTSREDPEFSAAVKTFIFRFSQTGILVSQNNLQLIYSYMMIQYHRLRSGFAIAEEDLPGYENLVHTGEYRFVQENAKMLYPSLPLSRPETASLAVLLIVYNESRNNSTIPFSKALNRRIRQIHEGLLTYLDHDFSLHLRGTKYEDHFYHTVTTICLKEYFGINTFTGINQGGRSFAESRKPFLYYIQARIIHYLDKQHHFTAPASLLIDMIEVLNRFIETLRVAFSEKKQIEIVPSQSVLDAAMQKSRLDFLYHGSFYDHVEFTCSLPDVPVLSSEKIYITNYFHNLGDAPNIYILSRHQNDLKELASYLIAGGYLANDYIHSLKKVVCTAREERKSLQSRVKKNGRVFGDTAVLFRQRRSGTGIDIVIYCLREPGRRKEKYQYVFSLSACIKQENVKLIDYLLSAVITDRELIPDLVRKPDLLSLSSHLTGLAYDFFNLEK